MRDERITCVCGGRYFPAQAWAHRSCAAQVVANAGAVVHGVANAVANAEERVDNAKAPLELAPVVKPERYGRYADGEKRKAYMRELMRKRRAEGKA